MESSCRVEPAQPVSSNEPQRTVDRRGGQPIGPVRGCGVEVLGQILDMVAAQRGESRGGSDVKPVSHRAQRADIRPGQTVRFVQVPPLLVPQEEPDRRSNGNRGLTVDLQHLETGSRHGAWSGRDRQRGPLFAVVALHAERRTSRESPHATIRRGLQGDLVLPAQTLRLSVGGPIDPVVGGDTGPGGEPHPAVTILRDVPDDRTREAVSLGVGAHAQALGLRRGDAEEL
jgi:hypothetical protein